MCGRADWLETLHLKTCGSEHDKSMQAVWHSMHEFNQIWPCEDSAKATKQSERMGQAPLQNRLDCHLMQHKYGPSRWRRCVFVGVAITSFKHSLFKKHWKCGQRKLDSLKSRAKRFTTCLGNPRWGSPSLGPPTIIETYVFWDLLSSDGGLT